MSYKFINVELDGTTTISEAFTGADIVETSTRALNRCAVQLIGTGNYTIILEGQIPNPDSNDTWRTIKSISQGAPWYEFSIIYGVRYRFRRTAGTARVLMTA